MKPINLIPIEHVRRRRQRRIARRWAIGVGLYALAVLVVCVLINVPASADGSTTRADLARLSQQLGRAEKDKASFEKQVAQKRSSLAAAKAVGDHPDWSILLESVARVRTGEIVLESFDLATQKTEIKPSAPPSGSASSAAKPPAPSKFKTSYTIKLIGYAPAPGSVFGYARRMEGLGVFEQVSVKDTRATPLGSMPSTRFEIHASISEPMEATR